MNQKFSPFCSDYYDNRNNFNRNNWGNQGRGSFQNKNFRNINNLGNNKNSNAQNNRSTEQEMVHCLFLMRKTWYLRVNCRVLADSLTGQILVIFLHHAQSVRLDRTDLQKIIPLV